MIPIIACSALALAIIIERFWALRKKQVIPKHLVAQVWHWEKNNQLDEDRVTEMRNQSPLGRVLAAGIVNRKYDREVMRESIEETGRHVIHELERFLNSLGTIAAITPLLGLLGTVIGMIQVFTDLTTHGAGDVSSLAGGIAQALITTAGGLLVAIPSLMFYRYFRGRIDELVVIMEQEAIKLIEVMHGQRSTEDEEGNRP
ncbi:MAG TPA: MotA/TolQ/ExbB proton channel family protein [Gammaproteobacteria bacterium]|nr:MotA/TolQ/ExbB proton channel family protein [Gammaproteobacteria bacterium]